MWKEQILSSIGEDPGKKNDKPKIFIKNNVKYHPYHQFYPVLAKIRINRGLLYIIVKCWCLLRHYKKFFFSALNAVHQILSQWRSSLV